MKLIKLHPNKYEVKQIKELMELFHDNAASKAVMSAAVHYKQVVKDREKYKEQLKLMSDQLYDLYRAVDHVSDHQHELNQSKDDLLGVMMDTKKLL